MRMPVMFRAGLSSLAMAGTLSLTLVSAAPAQTPPRRVLMVIETLGFHHAVTDHAARVLARLGRRSGAFQLDVTRHAEKTLTARNLRRYSAVVFFTTGNLPLSAAQKAAFMRWLRAGHGFVGIHCATDTNYTWPAYGRMIGGYFNNHPWVNGSKLWLLNRDPHFPSQRQWPRRFQWTDEFYQFRNWHRRQVHILLQLDPKTLPHVPGMKPPPSGIFASAWVKYWGKGRVFYTALGHGYHAWNNPQFQQQVLMGVRWADGEIPYRVHVP